MVELFESCVTITNSNIVNLHRGVIETVQPEKYSEILKSSFTILTTLLAITAATYIFSDALAERKIDNDQLLYRVIKRIKQIQVLRIEKALVMYLVPLFTILLGDIRGEYPFALFIISWFLIVCDILFNLWIIYNSISLEKDTYNVANDKLKKTYEEMSFLVYKISGDSFEDEKELLNVINDWHEGNSWQSITFDTFINQFTMLENLIKPYEMKESPRLFEENLERQLSSKYTDMYDDNRDPYLYISRIQDIEKHYFKEPSIIKKLSNNDISKLYITLSCYRDLLHYYIPNGLEKKLSLDTYNVSFLLNVLMLKIFSEYLSSVPLYNYSNEKGRYKFVYLFDCSVKQSNMKYSLFDKSYFIRFYLSLTDINNSIIQNTLLYDARFENSSLDNILYSKTDIESCIFDHCSISFSVYNDVSFLQCTFKNIVCQNIVHENSVFNYLTVKNVDIKNITILTDCICNAIIDHVNIIELKMKAEKCNDASDLQHSILLEIESLEEKAIYAASLNPESKGKIDVEYLAKKLMDFHVWTFIDQHYAIDLKDNSFTNGSVLNSESFANLNLESCNFYGSNFDDLCLSFSNLRNTNLDNGRLKNARLSFLVFNESSMRNNRLVRVICTWVNFSDSLMECVNATHGCFRYCVFDGSNCKKMVAVNARFEQCTFKYVDLIGSDWSNSTLLNSSLELSVMDQGIFSKTVMCGCILEKNIINEAKLYKVEINDSTIENNSFHNAVFQNIRISNCLLNDNEFIQCSINEITIVNSIICNIQKNNLKLFKNVILFNVRIMGEFEMIFSGKGESLYAIMCLLMPR